MYNDIHTVAGFENFSSAQVKVLTDIVYMKYFFSAFLAVVLPPKLGTAARSIFT